MHAPLLVPDLISLSSFRAGGSACVRDWSVALNCGDPVTRHNAKITPRLNVPPDCEQHPLLSHGAIIFTTTYQSAHLCDISRLLWLQRYPTGCTLEVVIFTADCGAPWISCVGLWARDLVFLFPQIVCLCVWIKFINHAFKYKFISVCNSQVLKKALLLRGVRYKWCKI